MYRHSCIKISRFPADIYSMEGHNMQIEQANLWDHVTRNANRESSDKAIAAYQAYMPESSSVFGAQQEHFDRTVGVSDKGSIDMATYQNPAKEESKTVAQQIAQQGQQSAEARKNEVAVVANTTSPEDLRQMTEDGFCLTDSDSRTIITVTDKIKAVLAKAGVDISACGDGLSQEQLEEITGSPAVAQQIIQTLELHDLPATDANVEESLKALSQAVSISGMSENAMAYLLTNGLEPTIRNVYLAAHSVSGMGNENEGEAVDFSELKTQIQQIIEDAGLELNEQNLDNSKWLIEHRIPLTGENLERLSDLQQLSEQLQSGSVNWNDMVDAMAAAISDGKRPADASMITARRKLEETRLVMTADAGAAMEKAGVEMDLKPVEQLVEDLKAQEKQYYRELLSGVGVDPTEENVDRMAQTMEVFDALKGQPAYVLGQVDQTDSVMEIHDAGSRLKQAFEQANESYETLMTSPRADMGDSIQKAFSNVDDILRDLNLETSEGNRRAVRILAYNHTEITSENIMEVKSLDEKMQRAFHNMNPAVTLEMIRKGENPLDMTMDELNQAAEQIKQETGNSEEERFSRYLWKLEQNHEISEEERSSYIGIYRLIAQVEKTDGAALGFLMNQGADITMRNLLTAVRSGKKGSMDYEISDDFAGMEGKSQGSKIDVQIEAAFQQNCLKDVLDTVSPQKLAQLGEEKWMSMTPEQLAEALAGIEETAKEQEADIQYYREQLTRYQQTLSAPEEVYAYLERYDIANSMANIMAVSDMLRRPNQMMERLWKQGTFSKDAMEKIADLKQQVLEDFSEALKNPSELADAQETLADIAENVMSTMIIEDPQMQTLDLRMLRQMSTQFSLCAKQAKEDECYVIPIETGDSVTGVSLKIVRGKKEKGLVDILFDGGRMGKVAAAFRAQEQGISGMITVDKEETERLFKDHLEEMSNAMQETEAGTGEAVDIQVAHVSDLSLARSQMAGISREERMRANGELADTREDPVQTRRLYHIAESFIRIAQGLAQ